MNQEKKLGSGRVQKGNVFASVLKKCCCLFLAAVILTGCTTKNAEKLEAEKPDAAIHSEQVAALEYTVEPETFSIAIQKGELMIPIALPEESRQVEQLTHNGKETSWEYPQEKISVTIKPEPEYLHVTILSKQDGDHAFEWPNIAGDTYYFPFGEGKRVPAEDPVWSSYLSGNEFSVLEQLSMPFWAAASKDHAVLYILENPFRNTMVFSEGNAIQFRLLHEYPEIDPQKENSFRVYITDNDPVSIAKLYRQYVTELGHFVSLEQKAEQNPNIRKLYGAPQIYLWGENLIAPENIHWPAFRKALDSKVLERIMLLAEQLETGQEAKQVMQAIAEQDYADQYQKNVICRFLSEALKQRDFYSPEAFPLKDAYMNAIPQEEIEALDDLEKIQWNKHALAVNLPEAFQPVDEWMDKETVGLIKEFKEFGIESAWIGLNSWEQAYAKPELVEVAVEEGYLIGPYDSYHSIHETGKEQWITAKFEDSALYEGATIVDRDGKKEMGFQNVGRKLNPTLSLPSVKQRVEKILSTGLSFNTWFIDCDATGEIYDDYTKAHVTTKQEELAARLERMTYIRDTHGMVIGSEGGNDFAASTISFAHGIELKSFSWMDEDMKSNKESEYYIGKYYNPQGGVAEHFSKRIPLKAQYESLFVDPRYDLPLFKLVYNDSVITSYHWDWSTFKIIGAVQDRMLREILYNVPPLYHLDRTEWETYKDAISAHTKVWAQFSKQAVLQEMTNFKILTEDGLVQLTQYGEEITVVANFSEERYQYNEKEIPSHSLLLVQNGESTIYTPEFAEEFAEDFGD